MKIKNILYATLFSASLLFQSCSLDEDTSGISSPDNFFRKYSECQSVVNSCYIPIKSIYTYTYMLATECVTDIAYCPSGYARRPVWTSRPPCRVSARPSGRRAISAYSAAISPSTASNAPIRTKYSPKSNTCNCSARPRLCARFYYWTLTCFFGNVPFYFDDVTDNEVLNRIQVLPRMDADETRATVIKDLQSIAPLVDQTRTYDNEANRLGASCAYMLIAKMAMWNKEWDTALEALQQIETIYGPLSQYDYAQNILFRNKNTPESIMEIQHTYTQGGLTYTSNVACICQPYPRSANSSIYDGVDIPELGDQATVWTAMRPNVYFCQGLQSKMGKDIRAKYNMAWGYEDKTFNSTNTRPWCGPKFWCPTCRASADGNNYKVFRYADALLMMAECYFYKENYEKSIEYLDMTRTRADWATTSTVRPHAGRGDSQRTGAGALRRIPAQVRSGALGHLVRCGDEQQRLWPSATQYDVQPHQTVHRYYPIPDTEVTYSKNNLDNNEYKAYGL